MGRLSVGEVVAMAHESGEGKEGGGRGEGEMDVATHTHTGTHTPMSSHSVQKTHKLEKIKPKQLLTDGRGSSVSTHRVIVRHPLLIFYPTPPPHSSMPRSFGECMKGVGGKRVGGGGRRRDYRN